MHAQPNKARTAFGAPGIKVTDSCEMPCRCWEPNSGPLEEHPVLLTTETSSAPRATVIKI